MPDLKAKLEARTATIGSWITIGHPAIAEMLSKSGFDWLTIDMEHSAITLHQTQQLIQAIDLGESTPLVRVGANDPNQIKRVMDAGAAGVIVPMVNSAAEAKAAVSAVKYPPTGSRGVGLARAQGYGIDFPGYARWNETKSIVIVQVEHIDAVDNLEAILDVDGVDGFIIGPYDLSGSLGRPGDFEHPDVKAALARVETVSAEKGALSGFHVIQPDPGLVREKLAAGYRFIGYTLDSLMLAHSYRRDLETIAGYKND